MKAEIVDIVAKDGVPITGALWDPAPGTTARGVDAWLLLPGQSGSFYSQVQRPFALSLAAAGYPCLTLSTRGHDLAWLHRGNGKLYGLAGEIVSEAPNDILAAFDVLESRGYRKLGLLGHSLGSVKSFYFLANVGDPRVAAFANVSGPRVGRGRWSGSPMEATIRAGLAEAERLIAEGKGDELHLFDAGQGRSYFTPNKFVDWHVDERYDVLLLADRVNVPMIALRGSREPELMPDGFLEEVLERAVGSRPSRAVTVDGADHFYVGNHQPAIDAIVAFVSAL